MVALALAQPSAGCLGRRGEGANTPYCKLRAAARVSDKERGKVTGIGYFRAYLHSQGGMHVHLSPSFTVSLPLQYCPTTQLHPPLKRRWKGTGFSLPSPLWISSNTRDLAFGERWLVSAGVAQAQDNIFVLHANPGGSG